MKFFLDTANIDEIRQGVEMGMVDGVTTNPSLVAKEGREFRAILEDICELVDGPVSAEVVSTQFSGMMQEAHSLAEIHKNIVVKIPMIPEGLRALNQLSKEGIKVNVTLIFSAPQALMAAKAGATYVSPFVGRLDDISHPGMDLIQQIITIFHNYDFGTQVLVASIRHPLHVVDAAMMGADVGTMPFKVLEQLIQHPLTDMGLARFLKDWEKLAV